MTIHLDAKDGVLAPRVRGAYWLIGGIVAVTLLPIASLAVIALQGNLDDLTFVIETVLPKSLRTTLVVLTLVAIISSIIGVVTAWLVTNFEFPFRRSLTWLLVLPIAIPPYIAAYCFVEFFHFAGPVQTFIRAFFEFQSRSDYWFPDIRSVWGAGFIFSLTLYPYVYLATRVVFMLQTRNAADAARALGASNRRTFFTVLLPMSRPAIFAGVSLALMETLNDIGASEYLGVRTLAFSVYNMWLGRGSLVGAAQLALIMLVLVTFIIWLEAHSRRMVRFHSSRTSQINGNVVRIKLKGAAAYCAFIAAAGPVIIGFGIPVLVLLNFAYKRVDQLIDPVFLSALKNTVSVSSLTAIIVVLACLCLLHLGRLIPVKRQQFIRLATLGYTIPGTVLALGLLYSLTFVDGKLNNWTEALIGYPVGLVFSGSAFAVVLACSIRFLAVGETSLSAALIKLPPNLEAASRNLGRTHFLTSRDVLLPLLKTAIGTSLVLVFVDTAKELSSAILLRPAGFNTLATLVYENASRAAVEDGAIAALAIVVISAVPTMLLSRTLTNSH